MEHEGAALGKTVCPGCGVAVAKGYPRCPKCHALMPGAAASAGPVPGAHGAAGGGGTSAAGGGGLTTWLVAVGGVAVVAAIAIFVVGHHGRRAASEAEPVGEASAAPTVSPAPVASPAAASASGAEPSGAPAAPAVDRAAEARAELLRVLEQKRLWAEVEAEPSEPEAVAIRSAFCEDAELAAVLDALRETLAAAGLRTVRCYARHGKLLLERDL